MPSVVQKRRSVAIRPHFLRELQRRGINASHLVERLVSDSLDACDLGVASAHDLACAVPVSTEMYGRIQALARKEVRSMPSILEGALRRAIDEEGAP